MAYIVKQKVCGHDYYYLRKSVRDGKKVVSKSLGYLGKSKDEAVKKAEEILNSMKDGLVKKDVSIDELAVFCKRRGFVYGSGEIYGGLSGFWDFGLFGVELKENIKKEWWNFHVRQREDVFGIDGAIITNPKVWEASGHVDKFIDYIVRDKKKKMVFKIDAHEKSRYEGKKDFVVEGVFNPMFVTNVGPNVQKGSAAYLRPETAQLIFANFKLVYENARAKLPFGIAQKGKSFRNEIAPRDFLFRSREFEQMEIEYFIKEGQKCSYEIPDVEVKIISADGEENFMGVGEALKKKIIKIDWHAYWLAQELFWFKSLGCNLGNFRLRQHGKKELAHYSSDCWDIEYEFPFGWQEIEGIADRGDYDLKKHSEFSGENLFVFDEELKKKILPNVVAEPSLGVERAFLVFLFESFFQNKKGDIVLKLDSRIAPVKASIFPIIKKEEYEKISQGIFDELKKEFNVSYDRLGSIGRRYARNDEIGTPYCITVDDKSPEQKDVTIRDRDTTKQIRVKIKNLKNVLRDLINGEIEFEKAGRIV